MKQLSNFIAIALILIFLSCKTEVNYSGMDIEGVLFDKILLENGHSIELPISDSLKTFYLIRHAEKDTTTKEDPALTTVGQARAKKVANLFKKSRIDKIYSTLYTRTIMTAQDLAYSKGMNIDPYDPRDLKGFADLLFKQEKDRNYLIVGHSNTTPELFSLLSGIDCPVEISESDYSYLFVVFKNGDQLVDTYYFNF